MLQQLNLFYWLRRAYDWTLTWAQHKHNTKALAIFGFCGAIFSPIPLDVLIIAMATAKPKKSLYYATIAASFSVLGAIVGYLIGAYFWSETQFFFNSQNFSETLNTARKMFQENTFMAMAVSGFTFLPFKLFTVSAGLSGANFFEFLSGCIVGRALRFFVLGVPLYFYGAQFAKTLENHFNKISTIIILIVIILCTWTYL